MKEVLFFIFLNRFQWCFKIIYIIDSIIQLSLIARWDETDDLMSKSQQSIRCIQNLK